MKSAIPKDGFQSTYIYPKWILMGLVDIHPQLVNSGVGLTWALGFPWQLIVETQDLQVILRDPHFESTNTNPSQASNHKQHKKQPGFDGFAFFFWEKIWACGVSTPWVASVSWLRWNLCDWTVRKMNAWCGKAQNHWGPSIPPPHHETTLSHF